MRVALYVRVSSEEQKMHGLSIEDQVTSLYSWAKKEKAEVIDCYNDAGVSARKPASKRPELQRLLNDVRAGKIDLIVFTKLDRWFRNISEYYKVQEVLEQNHVGWKTIYEDYDTTTASGRLKVNIMLSVAQDETDRTSERIKAVFKNKKLKGEPLSGNVPFGYKIENKHLAVVPNEAEKVKEIFDKYISFRSARALRSYLIDKYGIVYSKTGLSYLLKNPVYIGRSHENDNYCEPIIDKNIFDKTQEIMKVRAERQNHARTDRVYLFTGIVYCAECGNKLSAHTVGKKYIYYRCTRYEKPQRCTHKKRTSELAIEKWLIKNLPIKLQEYNLSLEEKSKKNQSKAEIMKIKSKMEKLKDLYLNDLIDRDMYEYDYKAFKTQVDELSEINNKEKKPIDIDKVADLLAMYPRLSRQGQKEFWSKILKKIIITENDDFFIEPY